jgi:hypothetical protein
MTLDDILLKALEGGPVTVKDIAKRFEKPLRIKLDKLRVRGIVIREGRGGAHRQFTYRLLRPDVAAKALSEKGGGLSRAAKVTPERRWRADMRAAAISRSRPRHRVGEVSIQRKQNCRPRRSFEPR